MLSFVYDGKNTRVYVNGDLVAEQQIREGSYGLVGLWLSSKMNLSVKSFLGCSTYTPTD